jgi:hypothetical protein
MRWRARRGAWSADLVVIGQTKVPGDTLNPLDPGETLLKLGRPTLAVPESVSSLSAEHVLIGWKDMREARRDVQDALPILHEASHVTVVEICKREEKSAAKQHIDDIAICCGTELRPFAELFFGRMDRPQTRSSSSRERRMRI